MHGLSAGGLQGASCQKQEEGEGFLHGHPPLRETQCLLSCLGLLECSVLTWPPAGEVPVTCLRGGFSPSQGGGQNTTGHWDYLRVNCRHVFVNTVRYIDRKILR